MLVGRVGRRLLRLAVSTGGCAASTETVTRLSLLSTSPSTQATPVPAAACRRLLCSGGGGSGAVSSCWKCSQPRRRLQDLFCHQCGAVQSPDAGLNHYDLLFGSSEGGAASDRPVQPTYRLDGARLAGAMRRLQWQLHPDKFGRATDEERNLAQLQSSRVNAAYRCLADPVQRAVYLLGLRGVRMPTEETGSGRGHGDAAGADGDLSLPQEFLAEMLELNEALMEADRTAVGRLFERVEADTQAVVEELGRAFDDAGDLALAKELTYRLRYFANIRAKIREMS